MRCIAVILRGLVCIFTTGLVPHFVFGQILISSGGYSQNFDSLAGAGTGNPWTDNVTLPGWYASKSVAPNDVTAYNAGTGSSTTGALYSFGDSGATERALGSVASGTPGNFAYGICFTNDTVFAQTNVTISYTGEQWRVASTNLQKLAFSYQIGNLLTNADAPNVQAWTPFPALDFISPNTNATQTLEGNDPANQTVFTNVVLSDVILAPGQELFLRWSDANDSGNDDGLAIDNLTVSFDATEAATNNPPPPATNGFLTMLTYNVKGNGSTNWSTNTLQVQAIGRELMYLNPDIITFNEIPKTNTWQMANWMAAFLPGYFLATNSATDGFIRSVIASRYPITRSQSWLNNSSLADFGYDGKFPRDLFEAQIAVPGYAQPLHVFVAHLKATDSSTPQDDADERTAMAGAISNFFVNTYLTGPNALDPCLLSGDMNEDVFFPETNDYTSGQPIQRMTSPPTGLQLTSPLNPFTPYPTNTWTESIQASRLTVRFDYILPCALLYSNIVSSQIFRTDLLHPTPSGLNANDDKVASDHLPVMMVFQNPYQQPFQITSITRSDQNLTLRWQSVPGQSYRVESLQDLTATNWTTFADNLPATNFNCILTTNVASAPQFFRVRRVQ